jgi:hypothetical protein
VSEQRRRRIDIIQSAEFTAGLGDLGIDELRSRRRMCADLDVELSYYRRLLHGRMDLLAFEQRRRRGEDERSLLEALPEILAGSSVTGTGFPERRVGVDVPGFPAQGRRPIDHVLADDFLVRLPSLADEELDEIQQRLTDTEQEISTQRRAVYDALDVVQEELTRRYREGAADAGDALA